MLSKCIINLFFIYISVCTKILTANELDTLTDTEKKYDISICAIFKDEALYLKDWIEYHLNIGVDHFYLYNIGSSDRYEQVLKTYIRKNIVTLVNWPEALTYHDDNAFKWALSTQIPAYENAVNFLARNETQWLVFLDINEFLVLPAGGIKKLLNRYSEFPGISFHSEFFDSAIYKTLNVKTLQDETLEIIDFPIEVKDKDVAKIIFKPDQCLGFIWPPYQCRFKERLSCIEVDQRELKVKRLINRKMAHRSIGNTRESKEKIAYPIQSKEMNGNWATPIYQQIPEFLKKLKNSIGMETLDPI
jgi:hypothetical protein